MRAEVALRKANFFAIITPLMTSPTPESPRIYFLPNLMTAGNLFCGFLAILLIVDRVPLVQSPPESMDRFYYAIALIFGACIFDLLDGRMARTFSSESPFGREFDSLADIVSFGVAPALLVMDIVLVDFAKLGWVIAFVYLCCGGMRLARFNVMQADSKDFVGFPIPAAAAVISSLTLLLIWLTNDDRDLGGFKYVLPALMVLTSFMMMSEFRYPSFKKINVKTKRSQLWVFLAILLIVCTVIFWEWMPAVLCTSYLIYGLVRPMISKKWRKEIEDTGEDEEDEARGTRFEMPEADYDRRN